MALARDLVELEALVRQRGDVDLFSPMERSGLLAIPECAALVARIHADYGSLLVRTCLQALRIQRSEMEPRLLDAELVATLPPELPGLARPTERVVHEMITSARREIILLGYELTEQRLVELLGSASSAASVIMICDRGRGAVQRIRKTWPSGTHAPRIFQDRERVGAAPYASMHAKCLLVDSADLLITSANFTFHGLHGNIEIGVRLSGAPAAEARKIFSHLVEDRIVEEVIEPQSNP